jgi:predicted flap endonuclease-1-like 5' DNA nuclease
VLYTLLKFLGWGLLLAIIGASIGWALRALKCRGELARARRATVDGDEVERMRHRLANLEQVVVERDRLRMQIADMRHTDSPGVVGIAEVATEARVSAPDPELALAPDIDRAEPGDDAEIPAAAEPVIEPGDLDLDAAKSVIGRRIRLDDLKVVEGVGPKIAELCSGIGITTWRGLADADVADLQSMLADAGSRYQVHDPTTWPAQARCLADGRWADFVALTSGLSGSR